MSYQALLFCPDEKIARIVTQVLGELDFNVTPCTEPFAAVKKFMGERFDAVVVDCDNEQNATLLFKSARSAPNNQGALAVAVVEGQAGVAKAFRIGANLVLTKPINVEQAKGTLRVARGLLRKNEGGKPANAGGSVAAASKPAAPAPARPTAHPAIVDTAETHTPAALSAAAPARPAPAAPAPVIPIQKPITQPAVMASVPLEIREQLNPGASAPKVGIPAVSESETKISSGFAASAPAPAREIRGTGPSESKTDSKAHTDSSENTAATAPTLTFGGMVGTDQKTASRGSKTHLIAAVAIVLIAAGGYAAWMKWNPSSAKTRASLDTVPWPALTAAPIAPARTPENASSSVSEAQATDAKASEMQRSSSPAQKTETQKPANVAKAENHSAKVNNASSEPKQDASAVAENEFPAPTPAPQPIVIKGGNGKEATTRTENADAPALSMTAIAPAREALPNFGPTAASAPVLQRMVVSQGVSRGLLVKQVQPVYPPAAIQMRIEGAVELMATIGKTGNISQIKVLSGDKELARAAIAAVNQWKYKPYLLNGEPVEIQTQITVKFKLPE
ncbi:MAG: TonB family protein [Candidatus Sulfotelmatobacter sp.]